MPVTVTSCTEYCTQHVIGPLPAGLLGTGETSLRMLLLLLLLPPPLPPDHVRIYSTVHCTARIHA